MPRHVSPLIVLVLGLGLSACSGTSSNLEAVIDPDGETVGFGSFASGADKSFGVFVCTSEGTVDLESVEPIAEEGDVRFLGALVYTSPDMFVGAADGFPPEGVDEGRLEPLEGAEVDADCGGPESNDRVQLIIGAERTGSGGGVLDGFTVSYDGGELEIPLTVLLCGDDLEFCEALIPDNSGTTATTGG